MAKKTTNAIQDQIKSLVARLDGTILEQPIANANKAFNAGIGLADQFRTGFEAKYNELAADGEKVRDRASKSAEEFRKEASSNAKTARQNVQKRFDEAFGKVLAMSPVATSNDVDMLNAKLDKVLAQVAAK